MLKKKEKIDRKQVQWEQQIKKEESERERRIIERKKKLEKKSTYIC